MLNLNDLRLFVKVAEWQGFAPASRALGVPKSTLSKRVAELERSLDVALIRRTSRRFVVTPVGRELLRQAAAVVDLADAAEQAVRGRLAEPAGPVSVTCSVPTAQTWLAALLPKVARRWPDLRVVLHATDRLVDVVRDGFDIAVRDHFAPLPDSSLVQRRVATDPVILAAAPTYLRRRKEPREPADLTRHDALVARDAERSWTLRRDGAGARGTAAARASSRARARARAGAGAGAGAGAAKDEPTTVIVAPRFVADETTVLLAAASEGLGIVALPARACSAHLAAGSLRRVLPGWSAGQVTTTLLLPDRRAQLPSVRAVADAIVESGRRSERPHEAR